MPRFSKTTPRALRGKISATKCVELRKLGWSYREIAKEMGITTQGAHIAVKRAVDRLEECCKEDAREIVRIELERLDAMLKALWPAVREGDTKSINTALRIGERRAKLLGLDAARKFELSGPEGGALQVEQARACLAKAVEAAITESRQRTETIGSE